MSKAVLKEISAGEQVFDVSFHPREDVLTVGDITGNIQVFNYHGDRLLQSSHHDGSCRGVSFSEDGSTIYSISSDKSLKAVDGTGSVVLSWENIHDVPINKLLVLPGESSPLLATGDDSGVVKLWDTRLRGGESVMSWKLHQDFISDFAYSEDQKTLISVAGDAMLSAYDIRAKSKAFRSDDQEAELNCVQIMKSGRKVVCGSQDGVILIFTWDKWGDCSDRYPGHPETVDSMLKIDENTVLTGSSDGLIRVVALQPNKILGVIGDHEEFPVEGMRRSRDGKLLASFAHDEYVRFWDISMFAEDEDDDEEEFEISAMEVDMTMKEAGVVLGVDSDNACEEEEEEGDWEDVDESEDDEGEDEGESNDDDDTAEEDDDDTHQPTRLLKTAAEKFYADL